MRKLLCCIGISLVFAVVSVKAQDCPSPQGCVLITREAALKALEDSDKRTALEAEVKVKDQAIVDLKKLLDDMRIQFAEKVGENTALKQNAVSDRAIMEILVKNSRKRCAPLSILCL